MTTEEKKQLNTSPEEGRTVNKRNVNTMTKNNRL